ncbi:gustatory receptor for sugar taste 43a isoform X1 [Lucilia sericata]|uniref:gustatory receptor for sugar taste 43a isoform X1 n=1 Tax=Lucilia sericata TaxID=13632 RepID=UPI0018A80B4F|nr:gustatory receptor for sugar taste 43a isoform X1 [Lucilia sericata]
MEISQSSISIFFVSKLLALAPYSVRKTAKGVYVIQKSIPFIFYAAALSSIMVFLTYRGLLFDANSKIPVRASFRMKSATSKVVTALDVSVVVMAIVAGVICGIVGLNATRDLNVRLKKVDESLGSITNLKMERFKSFMMLLIPMITISILLALDVWTWLRFAENMDTGVENADLNVQWYIPFYSLYFILTGLHVNFANTSLGLARRFEALNIMLRSSYLPADRQKALQNQEKVKITTVKTTTLNTPNLQASLSKLASASYQEGKNKSILLKLLAECHETLVKCVNIVASAYGMAVLFILISCFLHLVATSYFLFIELLSKKDNGYVWLQVLWILFHSCRLLMVVEPCHRLTRESTKTIHIVCEIERIVHDPILAEEVKKFWQQLLVCDGGFSACGLCQVNRQLLTSLASAIATYLVILIQFQKSNG